MDLQTLPVESAELDDVGPYGVATKAPQDRQREDVAQLMAKVAFICPSEIGDGG